MNRRRFYRLLTLTITLMTLAGLAMPYASAQAEQCGTFQQMPTPNLGTTGNALGSLAPSNDGTAWSVGSQSGPTTLPVILYFDGNTWSQYPTPTEVDGVAFSAVGNTPEGDVWMTGTRAFSVYVREVFFLRARDGEIDRIDQIFSAGAPVSLSATSSSDVWALTAAGAVIHFDGSTWTESAVPKPFLALNYPKGIYVAGPDDVWITGYGGDGRGIYEGYVQHWDGSSWTRVSTPVDGQRPLFFLGIDGSAADDIWIVGHINYSQHLSLHWDGSSWTQQAGPASDAPLSKVVVLAPNDAWATPYSSSPAGQSFYHWNGSAWSASPGIEIPDATTITWRGLAKAGACDVWASGSYYIEPSHHSLVARLTPGDVTASSIFVSDIAVTKVKLSNHSYQGQAVVTLADLDQEPVAGAEVTGHFSGPTSETVTATTDANGTVTFSSAVVGRTKIQWCFTVDLVTGGAPYEASLNVETMDCAPSSRGGGRSTKQATVTVFPSPFNPRTTFSFELPAAESVSLVVYDLSGRRVETLVEGTMPAGSHSVRWDASTLASGVYFYQLKSGSEVVSGRVTLLK